MTEEKHEDWRVVVVGTEGAKCRACREVVPKGDRAWFLFGRGLQHLECESPPAETEAQP
jgi:hypothetical protein